MKTVTFAFDAWTGFDRWRFEGHGEFPFASLLREICWLFLWPTRGAQVRRAARALLAGPYRGWDFTRGDKLIVQMPFGSFEIHEGGRTTPSQHHEAV